MRRGYITVFFAASMALIVLLFNVMIFGICKWGGYSKAQSAVDTAMISEFGEYNRELWNRYGLIFVDSAYTTQESSLNLSKKHLKECLTNNFDESFPSVLGGKDLYGLSVSKCEIDGVRMATDDGGRALLEQAVLLMRYKYGEGYISDLISFASEAEGYLISPDDYISSASSAEAALEADYDLTDYSGWVQSVSCDVPDSFEGSLSYFSILRKILPEPESVSKKTINDSNLAGNRSLNTGNLKTDYEVSAIDKCIFTEYLFETLSSYLNENENVSPAYQTEYLIAGRQSDIQNLEIVSKRIMYIRLAADILSLLSDSERMEVIKAVSEGVMSLLGAPEASPLLEAVIVAGWSYLEAESDMRILMSGKKVSFMKSHDEWRTGLLGIFSKGAGDGDEEGLGYRDYLRIFLFTSDKEVLMKLFENVIEADIRAVSGYEYFRLDNCFDNMAVSVTIKSKKGFKYCATRQKGVTTK